MTDHTGSPVTKHGILDGVLRQSVRLPQWQVQQFKNRRQRIADDPLKHSLRIASSLGRKKPVTLPTKPFDYKADE